MAEFVTLGPLADLQGVELAAFELGDEKVAVAQVGVDYYAFDDLCPHRQCSLGEGKLEGSVVTCPCHGSQFDVTSGERLRGPAVRGVRSYPVRVEADQLQVEI